MIMNKKSQFTKIFSQAILDLKNTGTWDIMNVEKSRQMDQSYNLPNQNEKALGYKKLAFLFAVLASGTFISLFVVFFEFIAKLYHKKQKSTITIHEQNSIDDSIHEILDDMSNDEFEKTFQRILQKRIKRFNTSYVSNMRQDNIFDLPRSRIPVPVNKKNNNKGPLAILYNYE